MTYFSTTYNSVIKSSDEYEKAKLGSNELKLLESVGCTGVSITRMSEYLTAYSKISNENYIQGFYYNKYSQLAFRLYSLGYISQDKFEFWEEKLNKENQSDA